MAQPIDPFKQGLNSGALVQPSNVPDPAQQLQKNSIAPSPAIGGNAQEIAANIFAIGQSNQDFNKYAKISAYDAGPSGANRDRYLAYGRDTFEKIGFIPGINNEAIYNENTSTWDDTWRMMKQAVPLYLEGIAAPITSYLQAGRGDFGQDIRAAARYEKASNIGYSTKGGVMPFIGNTAMSFAYTAGIMTEAAVEAYLLKKVSPGLFTQAGKLAEGLATQKSFLKTTTDWLTDIKNVDAAKSFYNSALTKTGNFLNPVTHSWQNFNSTILKNADNLSNLARAQRTFGAFYLDARMLNAALSEGRLEGGFVENEMMNQFYKDHYYKTGKTPDEKEMLAYKQQAEKAGLMDTMLNTGLVFYSNKIAFPNMMKFGSFRIADDLAVPGGRLSVGRQGVEFIKDSFGNALKSLYNPKQLGKGALNYFKGNLIEGLQEVMQEALAESTKKYYTESFYHPNKANFDFAMGSFKDGILSQLDSQGLETFGSGFLMGFGNKFLNAGIGKIADLKEVYDSKLSYGDYMTGKAADGQAIADRINNSYNSVDKFFGNRIFDYGNQALASKAMNSKDADLKDQVDAKDAAFISGVITSLNTGTFDMFIDKFNDIKQMKPQEVEDALNLQPGEGQKALDRIDKIIAKAETIQKRFNYETSKHKNPVNVNNYAPGTKEREDAELYYKAWEAAKFNVIFLNQSFDENLERINELGETFQFITNQSTAQNPIYQTDVTSLYDRGSLSVEIDTLTNEINALTGVQDPKLQADKTAKEKKLARLQKYKEVQDRYIFFKQQVEQLRKFGKEIAEASEEEKAIIESKDADLLEVLSKNEREYKEALIDYLQDLTGSETEYFKLLRNFENDGKGGIDDLFQKLVDIDALDNENKIMLQYINMLGDPAAFRDQVDRNFQWMKTMYLNKRDIIEKSVDEAMKSKEYQALLNTLSDKGIFIDLEEFAKWTKNNDYQPESFIDTTNEMVIPRGSELYDEYYADFILAAQAGRVKVSDEDEEKTLRKKINALARERDQKIAAATEKYNNALKDATGFTESELLTKIEEYNQEFGNKIREIEEQITRLTNLKNLIKDVDSVVKVNAAAQAWTNTIESGVLDNVEFQGIVSTIETDEKVLKDVVKSITQVKNSVTGISDDLAQQFGIIRYAANIMLDKKITELNEQKPQEENPYPDPKETPAYKTYEREVADIEKDYKEREKDIREASKNFKEFDNDAKKTQITALSDWSDIQNEQPELAALLEEEFKTYLEKVANYEEYDVPAIRKEWLKTQGKFISDYMNTKVGSSSKLAELRAEVPILKTTDQKIDVDGELLSLDQMTLRQLKNFRNILEQKLSQGKDLKAAQKNNLKADIDAVQGYIEFRRTQKPLEKYQEQTEILKEKLFDRQDEITKVPGQGYVIDQGSENELFPQRATELVNDIEKEITPDKPDFLAKSLYDTEALVAINAFVTPEEDVKPTTEARVNTFIETVKQLQKRGKFFEFKTERKLENIRTALTDLLNAEEGESVVSVGDVLSALADIAYDQASSVGTTTDSMIRDFLEFQTPKLPEGMTENSSVYKALFGPRGIITELRDSALDGEFTFIANYIKVFDKELGPLDENGKPRGLAGEMDILMVNNTTGELMILDIKTGKKSNWDFFNIDDEKAAKKSILDTLKQQREEAEEPAKQKELDKKIEKAEDDYSKVEGKFSKKLNYSIQQTIYRNLFYRMTGILPTRIALLPIEVDYTLDGVIKSAKLATQVVDTDAKGNKKAIIDLQPVELVEKYVPIGEVVPTIIPTQGAAGEKLTETDVTSPMMQDNLSKTFMYKGKQGKLIFTEDGKYALETPTEIIEISKQGKTQVAPESSLFDLGLTPISIIDNIGELITVDNKVYRVTNLNLTTDTVTINEVDYEIQRTPKKKQVNGVAYMSNQAAIRAIDEKIIALSEELAQRRQAQPEDETINDYVRTNATKTFELDQLTKDRTRLVAGNKRRVVTGGNVNDIIFVINKATAFQNFKGDSTETRLEDLDELKSMFGSDATFNALTSLFEGAPAALSKVFEEGFDAVTPEEITRINDWATATFMLAERQALVNEDEEIQNAISFLSNLINSIKLVELNKDGQVNPKSETQETQPGTPQPIVPKPGSEQPENVPGSEAGETGAGQEIEVKKADIERRRQEELRQNLSKTNFAISLFPAFAQSNMSQGGGAYIEINFGKNNVFRPDTYLTPSAINGQYPSITDGRAQLDGVMSDGTKISLPWNQLKDLLNSIKAVNTKGKVVYEFDVDKINAKYDAELAALGESSNLSEDAIKDINKKVLGPIQTQRSETLIGYPKVKAEFDNANQDTIDEVYFDFIKQAIAGTLNVSAEAVETLYKERKAALTTEDIVSEKDIIKGDILISQIPIFTEEAREMFAVTKVNEKTGKVTIKNLDNKRTKTFTAEEIQQNFTRGSMESKPIAKEEIIIAEETKKLAEETAADIKTFVENAAAVKEVTDRFNSLDNEEDEDDLLADAARNCNI